MRAIHRRDGHEFFGSSCSSMMDPISVFGRQLFFVVRVLENNSPSHVSTNQPNEATRETTIWWEFVAGALPYHINSTNEKKSTILRVSTTDYNVTRTRRRGSGI